MDLRKLIDFFPHTYKERDTYKLDGKGILERFLEICGNYLEDNITPEIDAELDLIDLDNVPEIYLNYLWEFLGEIPFANGISIDKSKFDKYYNGLKTKEELQALSRVWVIQKKGPVVLSDTQIRNILKYAITLIKIRGTKKFFEVLFKLYGFTCTVQDPTEGIPSIFDNWYKGIPLYDNEEYKYDKAKFDEDPHCGQCITVNFDIGCVYGFMDIDSIYFHDSKGILFCGKYDGLLDLYTNVINYNEYTSNIPTKLYITEDQESYITINEASIFTGKIPASLNDFIAFRKMIKALFDRYLPYNVKAHITYQGLEVDDGVRFTVEPYKPYDEDRPYTIFRGIKNYVSLKVSITSLWQYTDIRYVVSGDGIKWGIPHYPDEILNIYISGTYYIKPYDEGYTGKPFVVEVGEILSNTWYSIVSSTTHGTEFKPNIQSLEIQVKGLKHKETIDQDGTKTSETEDVKVIMIQGNGDMIKSENGWDTYKFTPDHTEDGLGVQLVTFAIKEHINKQVSFNLTRETEYAYGSISPVTIKGESWDNYGGVVTVQFQTNYGEPFMDPDYPDTNLLIMRIKEIPDKVLYPGDEWEVTRDGSTHFYIEKHFNGDKKHDARVNAILVENTPEHPTECTFSIVRTPPLLIILEAYTTQYIEGSSDTVANVEVGCRLTWYGTLPENIPFNPNVAILVDGVNTGVVLNAASGCKYYVDKACIVTFVSLQDNTITASTQVIDNRV